VIKEEDGAAAAATQQQQQQPAAAAAAAAARDGGGGGWGQSLYRMYRSGTSSFRVAVYGSKHDSSVFEALLQRIIRLEHLGAVGDRLIDTAALEGCPKLVFVSTLASVSPAQPFVFRNFELPLEAAGAAAELCASAASSKYLLWQARALSSLLSALSVFFTAASFALVLSLPFGSKVRSHSCSRRFLFNPLPSPPLPSHKH